MCASFYAALCVHFLKTIQLSIFLFLALLFLWVCVCKCIWLQHQKEEKKKFGRKRRICSQKNVLKLSWDKWGIEFKQLFNKSWEDLEMAAIIQLHRFSRDFTWKFLVHCRRFFKFTKLFYCHANFLRGDKKC